MGSCSLLGLPFLCSFGALCGWLGGTALIGLVRRQPAGPAGHFSFSGDVFGNARRGRRQHCGLTYRNPATSTATNKTNNNPVVECSPGLNTSGHARTPSSVAAASASARLPFFCRPARRPAPSNLPGGVNSPVMAFSSEAAPPAVHHPPRHNWDREY